MSLGPEEIEKLIYSNNKKLGEAIEEHVSNCRQCRDRRDATMLGEKTLTLSPDRIEEIGTQIAEEIARGIRNTKRY